MADATTRMVFLERGRAPGRDGWQLWKLFNAEVLNGATAVVDSLAPISIVGTTPYGLSIGNGGFFGLWVKAAGTTPDFTVQILESWDDTAAFYVVPEINGSVITVVDGNAHVIPVAPVAMSRLRIRLKANAGNGSNTAVTAYLYVHP